MSQLSGAQATSSVGIATLMEAIRLEQAGHYAEAATRCQAVLAINPRHPDALHLSGVIAMRQGRVAEAAETLRRVVKIAPKLAEAHVNLAYVYGLQSQWRQRADALRAALALLPGRGDIMFDIGKCHEDLGRWQDAADWYTRALGSGANPVLGRVNLGLCLMRLGRLTEAETHFDAALAREPANPLALANLAILRDLQGDLDAVVPLLDLGIAANPQYVDLHYHRALALLARGRLAEGWEEHLWRFQRSPVKTQHAAFPLPYWQGEPLADRCLLVWTEQGPGDEILLGTMIPDVLAQARHCILVCTSRLVPLFRRAFPTATVTAFEDAAEALKAAPAPDLQASLSHLGQWLRPSLAQFPTGASYLKADLARAEALRARYTARAGGKRLIGISWRSRNEDAATEKSTSLRDWASLLRTPGVQFVSLQYGPSDELKAEIKKAGKDAGIDIIHDPEVDPLRDMDAFAAQVAAMDAVVSVSNTTVHVAAALGKPVSILVPASYGRIWYWFLDRADSPWYPTARLYRQGRGQPWTEVIAAAADDLGVSAS